MIIETTDNQKYRVMETGKPELAHVWYGVALKKSKGEWVIKGKPRAFPLLVSKAHLHRIIEGA